MGRKPKERTKTPINDRIKGRATKILREYGYVYLLVEGHSRAYIDSQRLFPQPCYQGLDNYALLACWKAESDLPKL